MITLAHITTFFGWASVFNIGFLLLASACLIGMRDLITSTHSKMFDIDKDLLPAMYFHYLGLFKVQALVFSIVPYISLKIMGH